MTCSGGKIFCINGIELHFYALIANAIHYHQTRPAFVVQEDTSYLGILLYKTGYHKSCFEHMGLHYCLRNFLVLIEPSNTE